MKAALSNFLPWSLQLDLFKSKVNSYLLTGIIYVVFVEGVNIKNEYLQCSDIFIKTNRKVSVIESHPTVLIMEEITVTYSK